MKRSRVKARSDAAWDDDERRAEEKRRVLTRDRYRCVVEPWAGTIQHEPGVGDFTVPVCGGPLDFGHRRFASSGGAYVAANGRTVCRQHNAWCSDAKYHARALGGETPEWLVVIEGDAEWNALGRKAAGVR